MPRNLTETARTLRKSATEAESMLWSRLRGGQLQGHKFRRQEQIGRFIVDFVCYETRLIVEADGSQHASELEKDKERTNWLNCQGFVVLRFWNHDILSNINGVLELIMRNLSPSPQPSPTEGERELKQDLETTNAVQITGTHQR